MPPNQPGTFELVALELSQAFEPLGERLEHANAMVLLEELGLALPHGAMTPGLEGAIENAVGAAKSLPDMTQALTTAIEGADALQILSEGARVAQQVALLINSFDTIATELGAIGPIPGLEPADLAAFVAELPRRLTETIIIEYLEGAHPLAFAIFEAVGLAEQTRHNVGSTDPIRPEYVRKSLRLDRLGTLLQSPDQVMRDVYGWGQPTFDGALAIQRLAELLDALGIIVTERELSGTQRRPAIEIGLLTIAPTDGLTSPGLEATLMLDVADGTDLEFSFDEGWLTNLAAHGALGASADIRLQPPADITLITSGSVQGQFSAGISRLPIAPDPSLVLLGVAGGSGLTAQRLVIGFVSSFQWNTALGRAQGDFGFEGQIRGGKLLIDTGKADGFLAKLLPELSLESDFDLGFGWTAGGGVYFTGSSTLEIQLPAHISLGPIDLTAITISVGIQGNRFPIGLSTNIKAGLGPLTAVVEQVGASADLSFPPDHSGNLGPASLGFAFKPPNGVGLSIDTPAIKGGGFLRIYPERGEYAGALELTINDRIALKAIGLITTKMPDGSRGFSLLVIVTAEFDPGIQLGFGFSLQAVGGLLGLNRTMKLQPLMEGVRTGAVNSIMFPKDVIANAPKIISDLRAFFPPQEDTFLIGPMAKLTWGTPALISLSLGVIIEVPGNIAILGVLRAALPADREAILVLQVNFAGAIEFDKKRIYFFATLFESRVLYITIEGEMGLLAAFGDDANFVVSVGGFHPRFKPPPLPIPSPRRVSVDLVNSPTARVRVEGYFAVTTNTVQFGARAELYFGLGSISAEGHLSFDALFQFSPFYFVIEISASFSVKVFSIRIRGTLEGPTPWRATGEGSISLLFFDISVHFDVTWGESRDTMLPPISVMPLFKTEFEKSENWRALLPTGNNLLVSLRKMPAEEAALVLHPVGVLRITQRALPLELKLDKVGNQKPNDVNRLSVAVVGSGLSRKSDAFEQFAPAQFEDLTDGEKLSRPAFEPERAGLDLSTAGDDLRSSSMVKRIVRYEEIILDSNFKRFARRFFVFSSTLFNFFLNGASIAKSDLSQATQAQFQPFEEKIDVHAETFTVAYQSNNQAYAEDSFASEASARDFLRREVAKDANLAETLHVIPSYERIA